MVNSHKTTSNALLAASAICALLGALAAVEWVQHKPLTAHPDVTDVGDVGLNVLGSVTVGLRNETKLPIRLLGADSI